MCKPRETQMIPKVAKKALLCCRERAHEALTTFGFAFCSCTLTEGGVRHVVSGYRHSGGAAAVGHVAANEHTWIPVPFFAPAGCVATGVL